MSPRWWALVAAPWLLACNGPLVGGRCLDGWKLEGHDCVETSQPATGGGGAGGGQGGATTTDVTGSTSSSGGSGGCGALVSCGGVCVDVGNDPAHCGACGNACPSGACVEGLCQGAVAGHVVALAFDYDDVAAGTTPARLLGNATFLHPHAPLRVLDFRGFTSIAGGAHLDDLITGEGAARGRNVDFHHAQNPGAVMQWLDTALTDVFVLSIPSSGHTDSIAQIANLWAPKLEAFGKSGGVVVVLVGKQAPEMMGAVLGGSDLLPNLTCGGAATGPFLVHDYLDSLTAGVPSPFTSSAGALELSFGGSSSPILSLPVVDQDGLPIALHLVIPPGQSSP